MAKSGMAGQNHTLSRSAVFPKVSVPPRRVAQNIEWMVRRSQSPQVGGHEAEFGRPHPESANCGNFGDTGVEPAQGRSGEHWAKLVETDPSRLEAEMPAEVTSNFGPRRPNVALRPAAAHAATTAKGGSHPKEWPTRMRAKAPDTITGTDGETYPKNASRQSSALLGGAAWTGAEAAYDLPTQSVWGIRGGIYACGQSHLTLIICPSLGTRSVRTLHSTQQLCLCCPPPARRKSAEAGRGVSLHRSPTLEGGSACT